jgi:hypothetical protein
MESQEEQTEEQQVPHSGADMQGEASDASAAPADADQREHDDRVALFEEDERAALRERWGTIQASFVDEPQRSVEQANGLVQDLMQRLISSFGDQQSRLEAQWSRGDEVTTEDLRKTLQRYRSFFGRLLEL